MRNSVAICSLRGLGQRIRSLVNVQVAQRHLSVTKSSTFDDECMYPTYTSHYSYWKETSDLSASICVLRSQDVPVLVQQRVFAALKTELKKHSAVIIALESLYENGEATDQLCDDDTVLYNMLSEKYHVEVVMANVCTYMHFPQGALYSADIVRSALSKGDGNGVTGIDSDKPVITKPRSRPPKLVVPNQMKEQHILARNTKTNGDNTIYLVSGLRVTKK